MNSFRNITISATIILLLVVVLASLPTWNRAPTTETLDASANQREASPIDEASNDGELSQYGPWHRPHLPFSFTYQKQSPPKSKDNVASIPSSEVKELFQNSPSFDQIVELTKQMKLDEVEVAKTIVIEYWSTLDHGRMHVMYYYGIPTVVWFYAIPGDGKGPTYLNFHTWDEAFEIHSSNPIYKGYGNVNEDAE